MKGLDMAHKHFWWKISGLVLILLAFSGCGTGESDGFEREERTDRGSKTEYSLELTAEEIPESDEAALEKPSFQENVKEGTASIFVRAAGEDNVYGESGTFEFGSAVFCYSDGSELAEDEIFQVWLTILNGQEYIQWQAGNDVSLIVYVDNEYMDEHRVSDTVEWAVLEISLVKEIQGSQPSVVNELPDGIFLSVAVKLTDAANGETKDDENLILSKDSYSITQWLGDNMSPVVLDCTYGCDTVEGKGDHTLRFFTNQFSDKNIEEVLNTNIGDGDIAKTDVLPSELEPFIEYYKTLSESQKMDVGEALEIIREQLETNGSVQAERFDPNFDLGAEEEIGMADNVDGQDESNEREKIVFPTIIIFLCAIGAAVLMLQFIKKKMQRKNKRKKRKVAQNEKKDSENSELYDNQNFLCEETGRSTEYAAKVEADDREGIESDKETVFSGLKDEETGNPTDRCEINCTFLEFVNRIYTDDQLLQDYIKNNNIFWKKFDLRGLKVNQQRLEKYKNHRDMKYVLMICDESDRADFILHENLLYPDFSKWRGKMDKKRAERIMRIYGFKFIYQFNYNGNTIDSAENAVDKRIIKVEPAIVEGVDDGYAFKEKGTIYLG